MVLIDSGASPNFIDAGFIERKNLKIKGFWETHPYRSDHGEVWGFPAKLYISGGFLPLPS